MDNTLLYKIAIGLTPGIGPTNAKKLISHCGGVEAVFKESKSALRKIPGLKADTIQHIHDHNSFLRAEQEINFLDKNNFQSYWYLDADYPNRLKYCNDAPLVLYGDGSLDPNLKKVVGVVGTRKPSDYGLGFCKEIIQGLSKHDVLVVSGLAYGVDIQAHRAALENGLQTIACVGHSLDRLYPSQHYNVAKRMKENGGLLTEFISGTKPDAQNFPSRNRVIAGMSDVVLVIESDVKGGSLITAELAYGYNRDVMALPGRVGDRFSKGCNQLIKDQKAVLLRSVEDIEKLMQWEDDESSKKKRVAKQQQLFIELSNDEEIILNQLDRENKLSLDDISYGSSLPVSITSSLLLSLEFKGMVRSWPGKVYSLG